MSHCNNVFPLFRCQTIKPNLEEAIVKPLYSRYRSLGNGIQCNRGFFSNVPTLITPLLKKIRVASCSLDYFIKSIGSDSLAFIHYWVKYCMTSFIVAQSSHVRIVEQSFSIGFCITRQRCKLRQARTKEENR